jgi:glycosyltransferase involved in cell wall biosynthesis
VAKPLIYVVYPHMPHYRYGVFTALSDSDKCEYRFLAGAAERYGSIPTIDPQVINYRALHNVWLGPILWQRGLLKAIRNNSPDMVIFLGDATHLSTWAASLMLRMQSVPVAHWTIGLHRPETGIRNWLRLTFYRLANVLMLYGTTAEKIGASLGYPRERMFRIGNSHTSSLLQTASISEMEAVERGLTALNGTVLTAIVRLNPAKDLQLLIQAASVLERDGSTVTVVLAGEGPEEDRLRALARSLHVDLRLLGPVYSESSLALIYKESSITVLPSAAGLTVIQSLSHGVPVITHDNPFAQMPEAEAVIPGVTGELFEQGSVESLVRSIRRLMARSNSELAINCRTEANINWSADAQIQAIERVITAALE